MYLTWWEGAYLWSILSNCEVTKSNQPGNLKEVWTAGETATCSTELHKPNTECSEWTFHSSNQECTCTQSNLPRRNGTEQSSKTQGNFTCWQDIDATSNSISPKMCCWYKLKQALPQLLLDHRAKKHIQISGHQIFLSNGKGLWWMYILATEATTSNGLSSLTITQLPPWLDNPNFTEAHGSLWPNQALNVHV